MSIPKADNDKDLNTTEVEDVNDILGIRGTLKWQ